MIRPADFFHPVNANYNQDDPAVARYLVQCSEHDYFSPLLNLMQDAARSKKGLEEQYVWILNIYRQTIERKIVDPIHFQIALESAPKLIEVLTRLYNGQSYESLYRIKYNTAYQNSHESNEFQFEGFTDDADLKKLAKISCLDISSVLEAINYLSREQFKEQLNQYNPISFFIRVWTIPSSVLWKDHFSQLRETLLNRALEKIYAQKGEIYQTYLDLFPIVSDLFDRARDRHVALNKLARDDDLFFDRSPRGNRYKGFCQLL